MVASGQAASVTPPSSPPWPPRASGRRSPRSAGCWVSRDPPPAPCRANARSAVRRLVAPSVRAGLSAAEQGGDREQERSGRDGRQTSPVPRWPQPRLPSPPRPKPAARPPAKLVSTAASDRASTPPPSGPRSPARPRFALTPPGRNRPSQGRAGRSGVRSAWPPPRLGEGGRRNSR